MEHHRLKPMTDGYDKTLFNEIYLKTTPLRRKLAYEIDARKFGVDYDEILSWFTVKFIHSFNKFYQSYANTNLENFNGKLLGYIINALSTYKYRIIKSSYNDAKYYTHANSVDITTLYDHDTISDTTDHNPLIREEYMELVMGYMKKHLSDDAILVLDIQLNPPSYIISRLEELGKKENSRIPAELVADYLGMGISSNSINYITKIRKNINRAISNAHEFFKAHPPQLQLS